MKREKVHSRSSRDQYLSARFDTRRGKKVKCGRKKIEKLCCSGLKRHSTTLLSLSFCFFTATEHDAFSPSVGRSVGSTIPLRVEQDEPLSSAMTTAGRSLKE